SSAGSSPCIPAPEFNKPPTGGRDRLDDPPIRQFFFDAAVIAEDVDRHVFPESGKIRHSPKDDRLRGNENITSPTPRPFMGAAKPGSRIPSLLRDANFFIVIKSLFPQFPDLIREEGMSFIDDQIGVHFFPLPSYFILDRKS